jgi:hypothetical protein
MQLVDLNVEVPAMEKLLVITEMKREEQKQKRQKILTQYESVTRMRFLSTIYEWKPERFYTGGLAKII